ncbi:MAG: AbrB/MazE/SpoVT family DNA-binding domain-containing protein [archaeon]
MAEIKTVTISEKGQICIPQHMREELHFKTGAKLVLIAANDKLIIQSTDDILEKLNISAESYEISALSEESLKKVWDNKYDERWNKY